MVDSTGVGSAACAPPEHALTPSNLHAQSNFVAPEGSEGSATQLHAQAVEALEAAKAAVA